MKILSTTILILLTLITSGQSSYSKRLNHKGVKQAKKGNHNKALEYFNSSIQADTNNIDALMNRGVSYTYIGKNELGLKDLLKAKAKGLNDEDIYYNIGVAYLGLEQYELAIENNKIALEKSNKLKSKGTKAAGMYLNLGVAYDEMKQYDLAIDNYEKAINKDPENINAYINLGASLSNVERYKEGVRAFESALRINSKLFDVWQNLGYANYVLKEYDSAKGNFLEAAKLNKNEPWSYYYLYIIYSKTNDKNNACINYNKAIELGLKEQDIDEEELIKCK